MKHAILMKHASFITDGHNFIKALRLMSVCEHRHLGSASKQSWAATCTKPDPHHPPVQQLVQAKVHEYQERHKASCETAAAGRQQVRTYVKVGFLL
eukprot:1142224-Pelagomonas_calceolata.AAC.4